MLTARRVGIAALLAVLAASAFAAAQVYRDPAAATTRSTGVVGQAVPTDAQMMGGRTPGGLVAHPNLNAGNNLVCAPVAGGLTDVNVSRFGNVAVAAASAPADNKAAAAAYGALESYPMLWDGAAYDRAPGTSATGAWCDVKASILPTGAATEATLATADTSLNNIEADVDTSATQNTAAAASLVSIDGKVTACNTGAVTVASSALPTGAATEATLSAVDTSLNNIETDADATATSTASTAGSAGTMNTSLDFIETYTGSTASDVSGINGNTSDAASYLNEIRAWDQAEDAPAAGGEPGIQPLCVRNDARTGSTAGANGDFAACQQNAQGDLYTSDTTAQASLSSISSSASDIAGLDKLEDDVAANGDKGIAGLCVRNDARTGSTAGANGDYAVCQQNSSGDIYTSDAQAQALLTTISTTYTTAVLHASGAETASGNGTATTALQNFKDCTFYVAYTACATDAADKLDVYVQTSYDGGATYVNMARGNQQSGTSTCSSGTNIDIFGFAQGAQNMYVDGDASLSAMNMKTVGFGSHTRVRWDVTQTGAVNESFTFLASAFCRR